MESLVRKYIGWSTKTRLFIKSLITAIPFYFAALFSLWLSKLTQTSGSYALAVHAAVFVSIFTLIVFIHRYLTHIADRLLLKREKEVEIKLNAYTYLDRIITHNIRRTGAEFSPESWQSQCGVTLHEIQLIVDAAYRAFESAYGTAISVGERIDFEVTFMTKSYIDENITIPASANRDGRHPRSMILRQDNPLIYDNTVTALMYREQRPKPYIVADTHDEKEKYAELYPGQAERIRSSIIYPVLSDVNELLGALVVHCDSAGFFQDTDYRFWTDLLEVFAKRIAVVKKRLDLLENYGRAFNAQVQVNSF